MSLTRWVVYASFTGGIIALSLQPSGIANANATQASTILVTDQSPSSSQDAQRDSRGGNKGMSSAESSGKMQSVTDPQSGSGNMDPNSKFDGQSMREQGGEMPQGARRQDSTRGGSSGPSAPPGSSNPGMSGAGTGAGSR